MDEKVLFYIIIGIAYFLYNFLKKKKPAENVPGDLERPTDKEPQQTTTTPKPLTFEELLREITEGKQSTAEPAPAPVVEYRKPAPKQDYVDYDDDIEDEVKDLEEELYDKRKKEPVYSQYEEAKKQAFYRPSLEETEKLEKVDVTFGRFKEFETYQQRNLLEEYTKDLRDPEGFKKAVILSEILNRRHF